MLHELETWDLDPEQPATTQFLSGILQKFQIHSATSAYKIAGGIDVSKHGAVAAKQLPIGREFSQRIQKTFIDSLYALLDGLEKLSRQDYTPLPSASLDVMSTPLVTQVIDSKDRVGDTCPCSNEGSLKK
jgi:exocyst complex component 2